MNMEHRSQGQRLLRVSGRGKVTVAPDQIQLPITLVGLSKNYEATVALSTKMTNLLKKTFEDYGFKETDLKTTWFAIDSKYEGIHNERGEYRNVFQGYEFRHELTIEFVADNELLGKALSALSSSGTNAEFRIVYTVKDPEHAKNELLHKAMEDAKIKAEQLAAASGVTLGEIVLIDYSWDDIHFKVEPMQPMMFREEMKMAKMDLDINPQDINLEDTIRVVWSIK